MNDAADMTQSTRLLLCAAAQPSESTDSTAREGLPLVPALSVRACKSCAAVQDSCLSHTTRLLDFNVVPRNSSFGCLLL